jgi:hypothetical protein
VRLPLGHAGKFVRIKGVSAAALLLLDGHSCHHDAFAATPEAIMSI